MDGDRYDTGDLDAIRELIISPGWDLVRTRINDEIERLRDQLENQPNLIDTRGQIKSLRLVLTIPEILQAEIGRQVKE